MQSKEVFIELVDQNFFKYITKKSLLPHNPTAKRKDCLSKIYEDLQLNISEYMPKPPRMFISSPKNKYVIRMLPSFELRDLCIYYYCLKTLEDFLAENRIANTYGGFRLSGAIASKEELDFEFANEDSFNPRSFNLFAWKQEYGNYLVSILSNAIKMNINFYYATSFDIANFYDCIRLDLLKEKIKKRIGESQKKYTDEINILFRFLKYWNYKNDKEKTVGLPQEDCNDCSRVLANFFLQDYDEKISQKCLEYDALYIRYMDDQLIFAKNREDLSQIIYYASDCLFHEGLNINSSKIIEFESFADFDDVYGFSVFEELNRMNVNAAFDLFETKLTRNKNFRDSAVLKRLLSKNIPLTDLTYARRHRLISYLWKKEFLLFANSHYLGRLYSLLTEGAERLEYLRLLEEIANETPFSSYKIHYNKFIGNINKSNL